MIAATVMRRPPRGPRESVLGDGPWQRALAFGLGMGVLVLALQLFDAEPLGLAELGVVLGVAVVLLVAVEVDTVRRRT